MSETDQLKQDDDTDVMRVKTVNNIDEGKKIVVMKKGDYSVHVLVEEDNNYLKDDKKDKINNRSKNKIKTKKNNKQINDDKIYEVTDRFQLLGNENNKENDTKTSIKLPKNKNNCCCLKNKREKTLP